MSSDEFRDDAFHWYDVPRPTAAWRSAVRRRRNAPAAVGLWALTVFLAVFAALGEPWPALPHLIPA